jgi:hypothetical protein
LQGQVECCHVSRLLLDGEVRCSGNSVQMTSEKAPYLIHVRSLMCPVSLQEYNQFFKPEPIPQFKFDILLRILLSKHIFVFITGYNPKFVAQCYWNDIATAVASSDVHVCDFRLFSFMLYKFHYCAPLTFGEHS